MKYKIIFLFLICLSACSTNVNDEIDIPDIVESELYFPPINSDNWDSVSPENLNWNTNNLNNLYSFLSENNTRAFIVLKNGKIVVEEYWGANILNTSNFTKSTNWYWASAGKTITSFLVGIAQENGLLDIDSKTSTYLGNNWTSLSLERENSITVKHQLTMTTGLDYSVPNNDCTDPICLQYKADPGTQWYYHNAPYTLLDDVVSNASNKTYNQFTNENLKNLIGMNGAWNKGEFNNVYWSTARDAARFGLLILNNGNWDTTEIMKDKSYFNAMVNTSQNLNLSYGYLWWLNGKNSIIPPGFTSAFNTSLAPDAPDDLFAAMGKNGQFIDVVPSENLVVIRFGEAPDDSLVPVEFHNQLWKNLMTILD